ncbi:MAG: glycoside hydrolase family 16 protein [Clostridia bacterium]|nr:glycoside hydrolase family 16 protein [Clostridia bacterium]
MNRKKIFCLIIAVLITFNLIGCKSTNTLSNYSDDLETSTIIDVIEENGDTVVNNSVNADNVQINSSNQDNPTATFDKLKTVEVQCVKDIPNYSAEYEVKSVMTDKGIDVLSVSEISCGVSGVTVNKNIITVPFNIRKSNNSISLTVTHIASGKKLDFSINFNKWNLIFEDNFNGNNLDTSKWSYCPSYPRDKGYANIWNDEMSFVKDGYLVSRVFNTGEQDTSGRTWTKLANPNDKTLYKSGAVWSKDLFENDYGYYEISARPHLTTGMWGAFWVIAGDMDSDNPVDDNSAVNGAEIDIFESLKNLGTNHTVHWDGWSGVGNSMKHMGYQTKINVFDGKFHTFALRWTPDEYLFIIDGQIVQRTEGYLAGGICTAKGYLNITSECGTWGGSLTLKNGEYSDMLVDYVKVYTTPSDKQ